MLSSDDHDFSRTRMTNAVEFVWDFPMETIDESEFVSFDLSNPDSSEATQFAERAASHLFPEYRSVPDVSVVPRLDGIGRGAESYALVIEAAVAGTVLAGAVLTWLEVAERVARAWQWFRKRGGPPVLSRGAVIMLCAADLAERLSGGMEGVKLLWAGDVTGMADLGDLGYTGEDTYGVLFTHGATLYVYIVDDTGQIIHYGKGNQYAHSKMRFNPGTGTLNEEPTADADIPRLLDWVRDDS